MGNVGEWLPAARVEGRHHFVGSGNVRLSCRRLNGDGSAEGKSSVMAGLDHGNYEAKLFEDRGFENTIPYMCSNIKSLNLETMNALFKAIPQISRLCSLRTLII